MGSVAFIVSSWIMMIEEQDNLWKPKFGRMGWESAFWNLIGSWGFLLSAVFGYLANWEGKGVVCCQLGGTAVSTYWCVLHSRCIALCGPRLAVQGAPRRSSSSVLTQSRSHRFLIRGSWAFMIASLALYYEVENKKEQTLKQTWSAVRMRIQRWRGGNQETT